MKRVSSPIDLHTCSKNIHSQHGEDGILGKIFEILGISPGYFCEFGAWDGKHLSNSYALYEDGWRGCYIEGDPRRYEDLKTNIPADGMALVCAYVAPEGDDSLDEILARSMPAGVTLDLLSIDIDSDDLAIWRSLKSYRPKVVVIEYNPTIPFDVRFENPRGHCKGNAPLSIAEFAAAQGYTLVAMTITNLIFVDAALVDGRFAALSLTTGDPLPVRGSRLFFGYDGSLIRLAANSDVPEYGEVFTTPWNGAPFPQPVPAPFRRYAAPRAINYTGMTLNAVSLVIRRPLSALPELIRLARRRLSRP